MIHENMSPRKLARCTRLSTVNLPRLQTEMDEAWNRVGSKTHRIFGVLTEILWVFRSRTSIALQKNEINIITLDG